MRLLQAIVIALAFASQTTAQESPKEEAWLPKGNPCDVINFEDVCIGKVSTDQKAILLVRPSFKELSNEVRTVHKTVYNTETRTRTVTGRDGKATEESYTVTVPFVVTEEKNQEVKTAYASQRLSLPIEQVRAWDIEGNAIDSKELAKRLAKQTHLLAMERTNLLAMERTKEEKFKPIDAFYRSIIRPNTIVIYFELDLAKPANKSTPEPNG